MKSLFEPTRNFHIVISPPGLSKEMQDIYNSFLQYHVALGEIVSIAIFIEWFSAIEDRDTIKSAYITSIIHRCHRTDNTSFVTDADFVKYYIAIGGKVPFNLDVYFRGYSSPNDQAWINRMRIKFQREFLSISETLDKLYTEIINFYRSNPKTGPLLDQAAENYVGYTPVVKLDISGGVEFKLSNQPII